MSEDVTSSDAPTLTLEEAQQRLAELEYQLANIVPQMQADVLFLRGLVEGLSRQSRQNGKEPSVTPNRATRRAKK